jgi:hypothetical protein
MTLYDLTDQFEKLMEIGYEEHEQEAFNQLMLELEEGIEKKVDNIAKLVKSLSSQEDALSNEIKNLQTKKKAIESRIEAIKGFVKFVYLKRGYNKLEGQLFNIALQNSPPSLELKLDPLFLPAEYQKVKIEADNAKIKEDLKAGKELSFAQLVSDTHIRIR